MNIVLRQIDFRLDGIFGLFLTEELQELMLTLERGYKSARGEIVSKIKPGVYPCKLTWSPKFKKYLWLITGVEGHEGIRIHSANIDDELDGCVAPGLKYGEWEDGSRCILQSKKALKKFMDLQGDCKEFKLIVESMNSGGSRPAKEFDRILYESQKLIVQPKLLNNNIEYFV